MAHGTRVAVPHDRRFPRLDPARACRTRLSRDRDGRNLSDIDGAARRALFPAGATLLALVAIVPLVHGLANLERLEAARDAAIQRGSWAIAYAPPFWLQAIFLAGAIAFGLFLAWRGARHAHARTLAVFVLLLAAVQGFFFHPDAGAALLLDWFTASRPAWPRWLMVLYLRTSGFLLDLIWPPLWFFAAAAFVRFSLAFPNRLTDEQILSLDEPGAAWKRLGLSRLRRTGRLRALGPTETLLTIAAMVWLLVYELAAPQPAYRGIGFLLGAALLAATLGPLRNRAARLLRALAVLVGFVALMPESPGMTLLAIGGGLAVASHRSRQLMAAARGSVWALPIALALLMGFMRTERLPELLMLGWIALAMLDGIRYLRTNLRSASAAERQRVVWVYVGLVASAGLALLWGAILVGEAAVGCAGASPGLFCRAVAIQDWFLPLPLPVLTLMLALAVFYSGAIDSALVLRRTTIAGATAVIVVFAFGIVEHFLSGIFQARLPAGSATVLAAGTMALLLHPIQGVCERGATRLISSMLGGTAMESGVAGTGVDGMRPGKL